MVDNVISSPAPPSYTQPCLLPLLHPFRYCLHPFLSTRDAVRLLETSRSTAASLLADYQFVDRVFDYHDRSVALVKRAIAYYARHRMAVLHLCLPADWNEPLLDKWSGESLLLPASLVTLAFGRRIPLPQSPPHPALDEEDNEVAGSEQQSEENEGRLLGRMRRWEQSSCEWDVFESDNTGAAWGLFDRPLPPASLPHGLRCLYLNEHFDQPLQYGSIPATVEVLQFGHNFNKPLAVAHLPASLTQLGFGANYDQPLLPGVLPAHLLRLELGVSYSQRLLVGVLPSLLQQLSLGHNFNQPVCPGTIPPSVTRLRFSRCFNQPLQVGSIPYGVTHLHLGERFNQPLLSAALPTSLRELVVAEYYNQPLQPGSLPDGLEVLNFHPQSAFQHTLLPRVVPASVVVVSLGEQYFKELVAGGIPATVRWLRLPRRYANRDLSDVLSPSTRIVWWTDWIY